MKIPYTPVVAIIILLIGVVAYYLGRQLGKKWWVILAIPVLLLIISLTMQRIGINNISECSSYALFCADKEDAVGIFGILGLVVSIGLALIILPFAYLGSRGHSKNKDKK